jgi:plastocyanin
VKGARHALALAAIGALGALTCADAGATRDVVRAGDGAMSHEVRMRSASFGPRELSVQVGDTVVWHNVDIVKHNAVRRELFDTGELAPGEKYAWVPSDTGTYRYQCTIHQRMRGRLTVTKQP